MQKHALYNNISCISSQISLGFVVQLLIVAFAIM